MGNEAKWTAEPWRVDGYDVWGTGRLNAARRVFTGIEAVGTCRTPLAEANLGRAVACVNAMAGIPDPSAFVEQAKENAANRCDTCGAKLNLYGCTMCGAPTCCPACCRVTTLELRLEDAEKRAAKVPDPSAVPEVVEAWREFLSAQRTIDGAQWTDNYTDAARAREQQAKAIDRARAALARLAGEGK